MSDITDKSDPELIIDFGDPDDVIDFEALGNQVSTPVQVFSQKFFEIELIF